MAVEWDLGKTEARESNILCKGQLSPITWKDAGGVIDAGNYFQCCS